MLGVRSVFGRRKQLHPDSRQKSRELPDVESPWVGTPVIETLGLTSMPGAILLSLEGLKLPVLRW